MSKRGSVRNIKLKHSERGRERERKERGIEMHTRISMHTAPTHPPTRAHKCTQQRTPSRPPARPLAGEKRTVAGGTIARGPPQPEDLGYIGTSPLATHLPAVSSAAGKKAGTAVACGSSSSSPSKSSAPDRSCHGRRDGAGGLFGKLCEESADVDVHERRTVRLWLR